MRQLIMNVGIHNVKMAIRICRGKDSEKGLVYRYGRFPDRFIIHVKAAGEIF